MRITLLNHASILIEVGGIRLLTDPWLEGHCFRGAWGLRFENEAAFEVAKTATHLWISHPHNDHLHHPTLKRLVELIPDVVCLGNVSKNFRLDETFERVGFRNIVPLEERRPIELAAGVEVTRFPTTGIDNMMLLRSAEGTVLNYNDCVLPPWSRKRLRRRLGDIDVYLSNFNHGGKILRHPLPEPDEIRARMKGNFMEQMESFNPRHVIPFASFHYYRAPELQEQNVSLMEPEDLVELDDRVVPLKLGETFELAAAGEQGSKLPPATAPCPLTPQTVIDRTESYSIEQLREAATGYCKSLKKGFPGLVRLLPPLSIQVEDSDTRVELIPHKVKLIESTAEEPAHVTATSEALYHWWSDVFGTDTFVIGGHFSMTHTRVIPFQWQSSFGFMIDHRIDLGSILRMLLSSKGRRFLWNRREEIGGLLLARESKQ